jgi:hypothetical protein
MDLTEDSILQRIFNIGGNCLQLLQLINIVDEEMGRLGKLV